MSKKLTLSLEETVIEESKIYARSNNTSLSKLIESYLGSLIIRPKKNCDITPLVESLSGVIKLDDDFDIKESYANHLIEKYK